MYEDLAVFRLVVVGQLANPLYDVATLVLHPSNREAVGVLEAFEQKKVPYPREVLIREKALGSRQVAICQHPCLGKVGVADLVNVFEQHLLMVASQDNDSLAVTLLQVHDELEDAKAVGATVAVVAQKNKPRVALGEVDAGKRLLKGCQASVDVAHRVELHDVPQLSIPHPSPRHHWERPCGTRWSWTQCGRRHSCEPACSSLRPGCGPPSRRRPTGQRSRLPSGRR